MWLRLSNWGQALGGCTERGTAAEGRLAAPTRNRISVHRSTQQHGLLSAPPTRALPVKWPSIFSSTHDTCLVWGPPSQTMHPLRAHGPRLHASGSPADGMRCRRVRPAPVHYQDRLHALPNPQLGRSTQSPTTPRSRRTEAHRVRLLHVHGVAGSALWRPAPHRTKKHMPCSRPVASRSIGRRQSYPPKTPRCLDCNWNQCFRGQESRRPRPE